MNLWPSKQTFVFCITTCCILDILYLPRPQWFLVRPALLSFVVDLFKMTSNMTKFVRAYCCHFVVVTMLWSSGAEQRSVLLHFVLWKLTEAGGSISSHLSCNESIHIQLYCPETRATFFLGSSVIRFHGSWQKTDVEWGYKSQMFYLKLSLKLSIRSAQEYNHFTRTVYARKWIKSLLL